MMGRYAAVSLQVPPLSDPFGRLDRLGVPCAHSTPRATQLRRGPEGYGRRKWPVSKGIKGENTFLIDLWS